MICNEWRCHRFTICIALAGNDADEDGSGDDGDGGYNVGDEIHARSAYS